MNKLLCLPRYSLRRYPLKPGLLKSCCIKENVGNQKCSELDFKSNLAAVFRGTNIFASVDLFLFSSGKMTGLDGEAVWFGEALGGSALSMQPPPPLPQPHIPHLLHFLWHKWDNVSFRKKSWNKKRLKTSAQVHLFLVYLWGMRHFHLP